MLQNLKTHWAFKAGVLEVCNCRRFDAQKIEGLSASECWECVIVVVFISGSPAPARQQSGASPIWAGAGMLLLGWRRPEGEELIAALGPAPDQEQQSGASPKGLAPDSRRPGCSQKT